MGTVTCMGQGPAGLNSYCIVLYFLCICPSILGRRENDKCVSFYTDKVNDSNCTWVMFVSPCVDAKRLIKCIVNVLLNLTAILLFALEMYVGLHGLKKPNAFSLKLLKIFVAKISTPIPSDFVITCLLCLSADHKPAFINNHIGSNNKHPNH